MGGAMHRFGMGGGYGMGGGGYGAGAGYGSPYGGGGFDAAWGGGAGARMTAPTQAGFDVSSYYTFSQSRSRRTTISDWTSDVSLVVSR